MLSIDLGITERESELCALLSVGLDLQVCAARLGIRMSTARNHLKSIFRKDWNAFSVGAHSPPADWCRGVRPIESLIASVGLRRVGQLWPSGLCRNCAVGGDLLWSSIASGEGMRARRTPHDPNELSKDAMHSCTWTRDKLHTVRIWHRPEPRLPEIRPDSQPATTPTQRSAELQPIRLLMP